MKKNVIARFKVKESDEQQFVDYAQELIKQTRKEQGCLYYKFFKEVTDDKNVFLFYEIFENDEALEIHKNSKYLSEFLDNVTSMLYEEPVIEVNSLKS